jgi:hypothetical protein
MSEHLKKFLIDLASDPERMGRFEANPAGELDGAALSEDEKAAVLSRDSARLRRALGATSDHMTFQQMGSKTLKKGMKTLQKALKQVVKEEAQLKAAKKKKGKG